MSKVSDPVVTKSMLDKTIKSAVDGISEVIGDFGKRVDNRFESLEFRMNSRFEKLEARMARLEASIDKLTNTIDGFMKRLDEVETEQVARDAEMKRVKLWVKQIADETGVKLKGFSN